MTESARRPIRSFVRREGRMTGAQKRALTDLWPRYGLDVADTPLDFPAVFGRVAPVHLEIGFGNGEALLAMALAHPENDYVGIEVHRPGVGRLLQELAHHDVTNVRVICADAKAVLECNIPPESLAAVYLFFPDPWPKKRHHKRRLVQAGFVALVRTRLAPGGQLHIATDWEDYARHILAVLSAMEGLHNRAGAGQFAPRPADRPLTKFERRGQRMGHGVWDIVFSRQGTSE